MACKPVTQSDLDGNFVHAECLSHISHSIGCDNQDPSSNDWFGQSTKGKPRWLASICRKSVLC
jgi:hypothetical protein